VALYYLSVGLTYAAVGFGIALIAVVFFRLRVLGRVWGAIVVGLIGAFLGALVEHAFADFFALLADFGGVNLFPPIAGSVVVIALFGRYGGRSREQRES